MNSSFCSIGQDLASNIEGGYDPLIFCDYFLHSNAAKFEFKSIHVEKIWEAIGKLIKSKSFGNDGTSSYFLKLSMPVIDASLLYLFNTLLETSQLPDQLPFHSKGVSFLNKIARIYQFPKIVTKQ